MEYARLQELISMLELGSKIHISVLFMRNIKYSKYLELSFKNTIHSSPFCDLMKLTDTGFKKCLKCKRLAVKKALREKKPFGGECIHGAYEYCYPVVTDEKTAAVIFIGNMLSENIKECDEKTLSTLEEKHDEEFCIKLARVVESYIKLLPGENDVNSENAAVKKAEDYIKFYYRNNITVSALAWIYGYNSKYLGRIFKKQTGKSFSEYLNEVRIKNAKKLLCTTDKTVIETALECGFDNVTYFNRIFRRLTGMSPSQYREKHTGH